MAKIDPRQEGHNAAARSEERKSPYDGRTESGRAWYAGYDSYGANQEWPAPTTSSAGGMTLADTPFDDSVRVKAAANLTSNDPVPTDVDQEPAEAGQADLLAVGASTDPDVQFMAANRRAHEMILDNPESTPDNKKSARTSIQDIDAELRKMGYRA